MTGEARRLEAELAEVLRTHRNHLRRFLQHGFRRLADEADDILQDVFAETVRRVRAERFCPRIGWVGWLRMVARHRAIDRLRQLERRVLERLASGGRPEIAGRTSGARPGDDHPADQAPGPKTQLAEAERRRRQGILLSNVLEQFCRWCEGSGRRLPMKEAYERSLRGQQPAEIATAMGISANEVYNLLNRARHWVFERIRQADVDRSVFLTLHRRKPQ